MSSRVKTFLLLLSILMLNSKVYAADTYTCDTYNYVFDNLGQNENFQGACSGHGTCNNQTNTCKCENGWTGRSDFVNTEGIDCQINDYAVRSLWGFCILLSIACQISAFPNNVERYKQWKSFKAMEESKQKKITFQQSRPFIAIVFLTFVNFPGIILFGLLRIIKDDERVGVTYGATLLFLITKVGFYVGVWSFQPALFATVLKGSYKSGVPGLTVQMVVKLNNSMALIQCLISIIGGFVPIICLFSESSEEDQYIFFSYCCIVAFSLIWLILQANVIKKKAIEVLDASYSVTKSEKLLVIKDRITSTQNSAIIQGTIQVLVYLMFAFMPFFWNKHDYLIPITWVPMQIVARKIAKTAVTENGSKSKDRESKTQTGILRLFQKTQANSESQDTFAVISPVVKSTIELSATPDEDDDDEYV